jgi:hypothetical protein
MACYMSETKLCELYACARNLRSDGLRGYGFSGFEWSGLVDGIIRFPLILREITKEIVERIIEVDL